MVTLIIILMRDHTRYLVDIMMDADYFLMSDETIVRTCTTSTLFDIDSKVLHRQVYEFIDRMTRQLRVLPIVTIDGYLYDLFMHSILPFLYYSCSSMFSNQQL